MTSAEEDLQAALMRYEVARLTFRSLANAVAHRLATGRSITEQETVDAAEAFAAVLTARRDLLRAFELDDRAQVGVRAATVVDDVLHQSQSSRGAARR